MAVRPGWTHPSRMDHLATLKALLLADSHRLPLLRAVSALGLPDSWIGAGCVRDAVWDHLHGRPPAPPAGDVDVVWFGPGGDAALDRGTETRLRAATPGVAWSVTNQARMSGRNGDAPYLDIADALARWPETATAVAARWTGDGLEVLAPFGLEDLFGLVLRPTPRFAGEKRAVYRDRVAGRRWRERYPLLREAEPQATGCSRPVG
ncbi:nucleotidyltransferase family protein [Muricoccus radiodurans]|uniref:nucleotidyltransferase family protein n=1 Tax=Muricoccus radiodurans TaxID=2231721 RepID=UPI003CF9E36F